MAYYKRTTCRLCDSTRLLNVLHYPPQPLADEYRHPRSCIVEQPLYPLDLYLCEDCGCVQLLDVVSGEDIYPHYTYETGSSPALVEHFRQYAIDVYERVRPPQNALIVDIGGNDGTLLSWFRLSAVRRIIVDPAPIKHAPDILYYNQFFDAEVSGEILHAHGTAAIITANNVYANIDDLRTFTENVRNLLAPDGVFVFETFYLADLVNNMVFDFIYHEHLTAFSVAPLVGFFQRLGMQLYDVQRVSTKGGSIRCYVQLEGGKRQVEPIVASLVDWEYIGGLHRGEIFGQFAESIKEANGNLTELLFKIRNDSKTICGYGASPTSTTLIYTFGLGAYLDYLVDDWRGKQGTFSPGYHLPVYAPTALTSPEYDLAPDYCIVLAWRYWQQIVEHNLDYCGTWIVPLPELRIIEGHVVKRVMLARAHRAIDFGHGMFDDRGYIGR